MRVFTLIIQNEKKDMSLRTKLLFFIILSINIFVFTTLKCDYHRRGMPIIESKISVQLTNMISNTPALHGFVIYGQERAQIEGSKPPFKGNIWYLTQMNGQNADLMVFWEGDSNICRIVKVELQGTYLTNRIIWQE